MKMFQNLKDTYKRSGVLVISVLLSIYSFLPVNAVPRNYVDAKIPMIAGIDLCEDTSQMDCIQKVVLITSDGNRTGVDRVQPISGQETDDGNQIIESGKSQWSVNVNNQNYQITIDATLTTPTFNYFATGPANTDGGDANPTSSPEPSPSASSDTNSTEDNAGSFDPNLEIQISTSPNFTSEKLEVTLRLSWLKIEEMQLSGKNASSISSIISGGTKLILQGSPVMRYREVFVSPNSPSRVVSDSSFLFKASSKPSTVSSCADNGYFSWSTNALLLEILRMSKTNELGLKVSSLKNIPVGFNEKVFAEVTIPISLLNCWNPSNVFPWAKQFAVSFSYENPMIRASGVEMNQVRVVDNALSIMVTGLIMTNSTIVISTDEKAALQNKEAAVAPLPTPSIVAKPTPGPSTSSSSIPTSSVTPKPSPSKQGTSTTLPTSKPAKKATTITCIKGKSTKKITGMNPKCPSGYKRK